MNAIRETFIRNLKYYRKQKGMSQEKLSYAVGKSIAYINQIENKDTWPQPETVDLIAKALDISSSDLFEEKGCPQNIKASFAQEFSVSLEEALIETIKEAVHKTCKSL